MLLLRLRILSIIAVLCYGWPTIVSAVNLELTQGINAALPIGVDGFGHSDVGQSLSEVIKNDLSLSGQFKLVPSIQDGFSGQEAMLLWKQVGADNVVTGRVTSIGGDRYTVNYELNDVAQHGRALLSKEYQVNRTQLRRLAHRISDEVYEKMTGEKGVFSTHVAYIVVSRQGSTERYYLNVADMDGYNPQHLLNSSEPIMSPTWSRDGQKIAYVSFERKRAQIYTVSVSTGQRQLVTDFPGINGAPAWSPDGRHLAVVLSKGGSPKIYSIDLSSGAMTQLTFGNSIDTEPSYSPDGRSLLFTSGRGGSPQIYQLSLQDGRISRLTYSGNYNAKASFTSNQKNIVMLHRDEGQFNIGVQDLSTGSVLPLTQSTLDESPSIAPNGRLVLYATQAQNKGVLAMVSIDGRMHMQWSVSAEGEMQEPAWSPI